MMCASNVVKRHSLTSALIKSILGVKFCKIRILMVQCQRTVLMLISEYLISLCTEGRV